MFLTLALEALLFVHAGGSAVPAPDNESRRDQPELRAIKEMSEIESKGDATNVQQTMYVDRDDIVVRDDGHLENSAKEDDHEDRGKGSAWGVPTQESGDTETK